MKKMTEITFNIINNFLKIRKKDLVTIAGQIHNHSAFVEPMAEIPFIEELIIALQKKGASADLRLTTDNLNFRRNQELLAQENEFPEEFHNYWINKISAFIDVSWHSLARDLADNHLENKPTPTQKDMLWQLVLKNQKKLIFMNYPTLELSNKLNSDYDELKNAYKKLISCNYHIMKMNAEKMREEFYSFANYKIISGNEELDLKILKNKYQLYMGYPTDHNITVFPVGVIEFPMDRSSINGTFIAENVYYKNLIYHDVKINFVEGNIRYVTFKAQKKGNYLLQNTVMSSQSECFFSLGFNNEYHDYTGFYLYDRCLQGNIILKLFDQNSYPVIFANLKAELKKRK